MKREPSASSARSRPEPEFFSPQVAAARRFYLNLQPLRNAKLAVVCGGLEHCRPDYAINRTTFPFYSIEYVARGLGELQLNGRKHSLQPGRLFAYGPRVPQHITGSPDDPLVKYFVDFAGTEAPPLLHACGLAPGRVAQVFPPNAVTALFDELISAGLHGGQRGTKLSAALLNCLAQKIILAAAPLTGAETLAFGTYHNVALTSKKISFACGRWSKSRKNVTPTTPTFAASTAAMTTRRRISTCCG